MNRELVLVTCGSWYELVVVGVSSCTYRYSEYIKALALRSVLNETNVAAMLSPTFYQGRSHLRYWILGNRLSVRWTPVVSVLENGNNRFFSSNQNWNKKIGTFRPRRRPDRNYRPIKPGSKKVIDPIRGNHQHKFVDLDKPTENPVDEFDANFGKLGGDFLRQHRKQREESFKSKQGYHDPVEEDLRMMDYYLSQNGSLEDMVGERRGLAKEFDNELERAEYLDWLQRIEDEDRRGEMRLDPPDPLTEHETLFSPYGGADDDDDTDKDPETYLDPNQLAHGEWSQLLVSVDRNIKLWRGGRLESYRALVVGGNMNGCGGYGMGKSTEAFEAVNKASRACKRNIFFVDRYQGNGLTRDLVGKQNSCKLVIRANDSGLYGNELVREILKRFGITNAAAKAYGNRTTYNVVQAAFKALMTHESLEDIAMKRGKRIISIDRSKRLRI
jgi:small subunit ribosomal protein S5